ncbi:CaiB/BaiF CoA transferase family protein [Conexibacter woesei]|uniref:L-carnitine dehydratase/bile acid-inducible protein F n=1 Tax=Conexibacter woesei (strain DSM 14684 / CCUG 47730 / CIP 108061 / JCM 11494 / NBRC 100937 / ID131577) TaxID=469383 RepID=D3F5E1_CONWI|nr:CoA transferase [Conexibacter woesei]ADB50608.1 L-carnitine dehydratase/bile acid-inducible protein F [Conexibacter woesei DSM 14684]
MRSDHLEGVRVLAVEQYGAGPFGTQLLGHLGAEVVKVENPAQGGDVSRSVGPHFRDDLPPSTESIFFQGLNRNKKSVALDLGTPEGQAALRHLARDADALVSNLRGDVPARLGLTYAALADVNPRLVCAHLTGYGRGGERARRPGYDFLMQAELGYFDLTGDPDGVPARMGLSMVDLMGGAMLALATVSAIVRARAGGRGGEVDVSLFDVALFDLNYVAHWYLNAGARTTRLPRSAHPSLTPCQTYRTADGWIYLMCNKEKFWPALCELVDRPQWAREPRFATFPDRLAARAELTELLDDVLFEQTTAAWMERFAGAVPAAPVLALDEALEQPFVHADGRVETLANGLRLLASPFRGDAPTRPSTAPPALGEHTAELLDGLPAAP